MSSTKTIIKTEDAKRIFTTGEIEVHALRGVNLDIKQGEFVVILGASGSGKTTLLNQIGGIDTPTSGKIIIEGEDITEFDEKKLTQHRRGNIGWIFQFHNLIPSLNVVENVQLALELMGEKEDQKSRAEQALEAVGLGEMLDRFPAQLSGGQQQRVAIARALVKHPKIIVADEPTGNLDKKTSQKITELMFQICRDKLITFCIVTHDPSMSSVADRLLLMEDGMISDDPELLKQYRVVAR